ncbi:MAG: exodeoxyribonuclease VII large subunit [Oscillospiraceae bacterium]|nr:exodeoxyribonuclease VII large subunit [Oscillospiraceae bacterium]
MDTLFDNLPDEEGWVLSVAQLNEYVRRSLAADPMLKRVALRGEISNFKRHTSGHLYFSLKDEEARIACVMFRQHAYGLAMHPQDGQRVVLTGQAALYAKDGQYQFYAQRMRRDGVGDLFLRFEALKRKLDEEGLFDPSRKRPLPLLPRIVGVVTSPTGAAIRDIVQVATRRNPRVRILLCPVRVQGEGAAQEIARGIAVLSRVPGVDVLLVGRGGGSMEELWAFNEETVARAICASPVPVVSAVGHETDFTIADFVSDLRAPTPSAAAEHAVPRMADLQDALASHARRLRGALAQRMAAWQAGLRQARLSLLANAPQRALAHQMQRLTHAVRRLDAAAAAYLAARAARLNALAGVLSALSPQSVLARGYAYLTAVGRPVTSAAALYPGLRLGIRLRDGEAQAVVEEVQAASAQKE